VFVAVVAWGGGGDLQGLARDQSLRSIADRLGRAPSTVSREVNANGGPVKYRATVAHRASRRRAKRPKAMKLQECPRLVKRLRPSWSCGGRRLRFRGGWFGYIVMMRRCGCHMKRSTNPCSCRAEGRWVRNCGVLWALGVPRQDLRDEQHRPKVRFGTWS
jgi:hypothetical protein